VGLRALQLSEDRQNMTCCQERAVREFMERKLVAKLVREHADGSVHEIDVQSAEFSEEEVRNIFYQYTI